MPCMPWPDRSCRQHPNRSNPKDMGLGMHYLRDNKYQTDISCIYQIFLCSNSRAGKRWDCPNQQGSNYQVGKT